MRTRLSTLLALVLVLSLAVSGVAAYAVLRITVNDRIEASLQRVVEQVALLSETGVDPETGEPPDSAAAFIRLAMLRVLPHDNEGILGLAPDRAELAASGAVELRLEEDPELVAWALARVGDQEARAETVTTDSTTYRAVVVPVTGWGQDDAGALLLAVDVDAEVGRLDRTFLGFAGGALLTTVFALAVGVPLLRRVFAPLESLQEAVGEVTEHDLDRRVEVIGHDDVAALGHSFNAMLERLEDSFASQRRLLDDAGHELRTPVTIVQGHLEVMDPDDPADVRETTRLTLDELDRMSRLVDDLLVLAKAQHPDFLRPAPVDVAELTRGVLARASGFDGHVWELDGVAEATVSLDAQRITQAWLQLAANAVRYSEPGTVVRLGSAVEGGRLRLWVQDHGVGVRPQDRAQIFERFGRGAHGTRADGSGLGLAIVSSIAAAHGGEVSLDSVPGLGSVFRIELPLSTQSRPAGSLTPGKDPA
ncbi:HAMP domain-containing histidine kinase [Micrococcus sp. HG099]|uniref:sensor histidine kinase n=1 Tax=Micrococcus sp. HG099 TaxID=2969755 RepID=UPI00215B63DE|nr:HAMP domain-containing sensor histidine kinase [Micrococcus sp. HG099]MCR8676311.1 HAMP domain-containing histidine kinase [Micrococcus sp. HG099]